MASHPSSTPSRWVFSRLTVLAMVAATILVACAPDTAPNETAPDEADGEHAGGLAAPGSGQRHSTLTGAAPWITPGERLGVAGCPLFPADHAWRASVDSLPAAPFSDLFLAANGGAQRPLKAGFSAGVWEGSRAGIPLNVVDGATAPRTDVVVHWDGGTGAERGVPIPEAPRFEGWPGRAWDVHLLSVDTSTCESREMLNVRDPSVDPLGLGGGRWYADSAATFDLLSNESPGWGADAAGTSIVAGLVRYDEVASGTLGHAISASFRGLSAGAPLWPAQNTDGTSTLPWALPMGTWLRLRPGADVSTLGPQARVIAEAMQRHGVILTDTGPGWNLRGEPDVRWDDRDIDTLGNLSLADFEIIDASPMMLSPDSHQLRPTR